MSSQRRKKPRYQREADRPARIAANLSAQAPNNSYDPPAFYEDVPFLCEVCGSKEIWTATQQQWWYEVAKGTIYSRAKLCRACRTKRRESHQGTPRRSHAERRASKETGL